MVKKWLVGLTVLALLVPFATLSFAQESAAKGNLGGLAVDSTGAVIPGATVTITGATGSRTEKTDEAGNFMFSLLTPGFYSVKVEKQGFKVASVKSVEVLLSKTQVIRVTLEPGAVSEVVEVTATAAVVDVTSTAVGANLPDSFYQSVPVPRAVSGLFYITPGAVSGGGTGTSNPSVSGASGLENLYMADGVNITDRSFGGLGIFTRAQGSVGTGINLSFIKEVSVKTGGFEPQYGQATGGVVQMVTKSGGNAYHGEIGGYFAPSEFEAQYNQSDAVRVNKAGLFLNRGNFDVDGELGGYVPGFKDHLFFFASFDPTWNQQFVMAPPTAGLAALGVMKLQADVFNYAGKLTWKINDKHQIETSLFGDPARTTTGEQNYVLNTPNATAMSRWNYGTRNWVVRYNGTLTPSWLVNGSFTWNNAKFTETPLFDQLGVTNRLVSTNVYPLQGFGFLEDYKSDGYALNFDTQKVGHWLGQHTLSFGYRYERDNYTDYKTATGGRFPVPTLNAAGTGWMALDPTSTFPVNCAPGPNCALGETMYLWGGSLRTATTTVCDVAGCDPEAAGFTGGDICTLCPIDPITGLRAYVRYSRGEYDPNLIPTFGRYHAAYANDTWEINKHITLSAGLRWEQWRMAGTFSSFTFTDNWAPRIGIAVDPWGDHKTKIFANFGRYNYQTPLDAAIRSLSAEQDIINYSQAPVSVGGVIQYNPDGTLTLPIDSAHTLNMAGVQYDANGNSYCPNPAACGVPITPAIGLSQTAVAPGTKLMYQNEWVVGAEHQFHNGVVLQGRFIYRNLPRAMDDVAGISPEAYVWFATQNYFIANPSPGLDLYPNANEQLNYPTAGGGAISSKTNCTNHGGIFEGTVQDVNGGATNPATGAPWGSNLCYLPNGLGQFGGEVGTYPSGLTYPLPDGQPDGFPQVVHNYKAVEIEANKAFANNWMLRANWRIASLYGNYEGAYRNDNGQTDPNISSLFDFTNGVVSMLGQQYQPGPLNTDRRHVVNVYASYIFSSTFLKNLELGTGVNFQSGTPISKLANHPAYANAGEIPLGGRGSMGRTPFTGVVNVHADRPFKVTEKSQLHLTADLFNLTNNKQITRYDEFYQISGTTSLNPDFDKVRAWQYQRPFYARFSFRWVF